MAKPSQENPWWWDRHHLAPWIQWVLWCTMSLGPKQHSDNLTPWDRHLQKLSPSAQVPMKFSMIFALWKGCGRGWCSNKFNSSSNEIFHDFCLVEGDGVPTNLTWWMDQNPIDVYGKYIVHGRLRRAKFLDNGPIVNVAKQGHINSLQLPLLGSN